MTNEEIEAARIEQGVPEGSVWMSDGWCLPDTLARLNAQMEAIEAKMAEQEADPNPANCHCFGVCISGLEGGDFLDYLLDKREGDNVWEVWHNPETGFCEPRRKLVKP